VELGGTVASIFEVPVVSACSVDRSAVDWSKRAVRVTAREVPVNTKSGGSGSDKNINVQGKIANNARIENKRLYLRTDAIFPNIV
jgi:hypothetical protein